MSSDESDVSSEEEVEEVLDLSNQTVVTKYRGAADIANRTLQGVLQRCKAGQGIFCEYKTQQRMYFSPLTGHVFSCLCRRRSPTVCLWRQTYHRTSRSHL